VPVPVVSIACPFCGLVCDDVVLEGDRVDTHGCAKGAAGFARRPATILHRVAGQAASLAQAAAAAGSLLGAARLPLITGTGADLAGVRGLLALADRLGAVVDRWQSSAQLANLAVVQRAGALAATFGEVANRADVVLLLGRDPAREHPRFFERLLRNRAPLYRNAPWVTYLGPDSAAPGDAAVSERIALEPDRLVDALSVLAVLLGGRRVAANVSLPHAQLAALAERLQAAHYGAIVWDAAAFPAAVREPVATLVLQMLRETTLKTRCVGLPLGGADNAQGAAQAMLWQAGWPGRLCFAGGVPTHDPWLYDAERLLAAGEADALLWVAAATPSPPPATAPPTVALVAADAMLPVPPAVEIRVGISGIDHSGTMMRADTIVALPLAASRPSGLPSVAAAAAAILARLGAAS
jgi:formylmethanofuran dehydrogenase subunit B